MYISARRLLSILILTMNLFNLFGQSKNPNDPYWEFDKANHFKPQLNKGSFFKLTGFDFGYFILEPLFKMVKSKEHEHELGKRLSYGQKALYYWWYMDAQVTNGGFVQFYYNGYDVYIPTIIKGLEYIGDREMVSLIKQADSIYQKQKKLVTKAKEKDLFESDLHDQLEELSDLNRDYYKLNKSTMSKIEEFIRKNSHEFCVDEDGKEFDLNFSGECKSYHQNGNPRDIFYLKNGTITGEYRTYFESGQLQEVVIYNNGKPTGETEVFYENGSHRYRVTLDTVKHVFKYEWFYENGNPKRLEYKTQTQNKKTGEYKEWYNDGQLAETGIYTSQHEHERDWLEFYQDGSKKLEADFQHGKLRIKNCWSEKGEHILKDGTGLYIHEFPVSEGTQNRDEREYKGYKQHGLSKFFVNGQLTLTQEFQDGIQHGTTRRYYNNGNIETEIVYQNGKKVSEKKFDKFKNPYVATTITCEIKNEWLINRELAPVDTYTIALNAVELGKNFKTGISFFDGYQQDRELSYTYFVTVDNKGNVIKMDFLVADNGRIVKEVESSISKLKFIPATKDNKPVVSYCIVKYTFKLAEE